MKLRFLAASVVGHVLLLLPFLLERKEPETEDPFTIAVEIWEEARSLRSAKGRGGKGEARGLAMRDLMPGSGSQSTHGTEGGNVDAYGEWGSGGGQFENIKDYVFMRRVHSEVEGLLFYPGILARHGISGTINTRVRLEPGNGCDWKHIIVKGGHPYLKVYVMSLLKKLCALEVAKNPSGQLNVDMSFTFEITERTEDSTPSRNEVIGNVLVFNRNYGESVTEWKLGPIRGSWLIPAISIDFPWIYENWDKHFKGRDPFEAFRDQG